MKKTEGGRIKVRSQGNAIYIVLAILAGFILLFFGGGAAMAVTISTIFNRTGELNPSGVNFGSACGGITAPATTQTLDSYQIPDNGTGKINSELHLTTTNDTVKFPTNDKEGIDDHIKVTNFSTNCPSSSGYCDPTKQVWTPAEGGGNIGEGNTVGRGNIPSEVEPWIMNARWPKPYPKPGTKVIITAESTKRSIVAVAGYEWGPGTGPHSKGIVAGAQYETMANLGISSGAKMTFGFAVDQTLAPGTIYGEDCITSGSRTDTPLLKQGNDKWGSYPYTHSTRPNATISSSGCGITALAMVLQKHGIMVTPKDTAKYSKDNGFRVEGGTSHGLFEAAARHYNLQYEQVDLARAKELLAQKQPLIISIRGSAKGDKYKGGHFIVLTYYDGTHYFINDSAGANFTKFTESQLTHYQKYGYWYLHR